MSAIAGIIKFDTERIERRQIELIAQPLPGDRADTKTTWGDASVGLTHASSFTPNCASSETQPLVDSAGGCVVTFDGRLDNRAELCATFDARPSQTTDAALIAAAYRKWGNDFANQLYGDFAIALWDTRARQLILVRDPLGQRPLYYSADSTRIIFASTLEQLLADPTIPRDWDEETLPYYFYAYGWLETKTIYRAIKSLPGGSRLIARDGQVRVERYWHWRDTPPEPRALTPNDLDEFRATLTATVAARLRADCPVGLQLSGGLDSGTIASIAGDLYQRDLAAPLRTYSLVFERYPQCDERQYINPIIARYHLPWTPVIADDCWTLADLATELAHAPEPYFEAYDGMKCAMLDRARADDVRVMLMGHGGDSLLNGSARAFADFPLQGRWRELHQQLRAFARATNRPYWQSFAGNVISPWMPSAIRAHIEYRYWRSPRAWLPPRWRKPPFDALPKLYRGKHAWWHDLRDQLAGFGSTPHEAHIDRTPRRFGMEIRQPFLDVRLFNLVLNLPPEATYSNGTPRFIMREAFKDVLPPEIYARRGKAEFSPLLRLGLRERKRTFVASLLDDSELARRELVVDKAWRATIQNYLDGKSILTWIEWRGLVVEMWLRAQTGRLVID